MNKQINSTRSALAFIYMYHITDCVKKKNSATDEFHVIFLIFSVQSNGVISFFVTQKYKKI